MKTYHFISGLPRAGSTVLASILNQNPKFHANISNPLARFVRAIVTETFASPGYQLECSEHKRIKLIKNLIKTYHDDIDQAVCFNTNRGWTALLPLLEQVSPDSKVICCVRDIRWILDSFEVLFRKNPFSISKIYGEETDTVYTRTMALMSPGSTVRFAYDSLKEAITGNQKHMLMLIEYEALVKYPKQTMQSLYNFIEESWFEHDFDNIEYSYDEYDQDVGIKGLHAVRKKLEFISREPILPPDLWKQLDNLEVWR